MVWQEHWWCWRYLWCCKWRQWYEREEIGEYLDEEQAAPTVDEAAACYVKAALHDFHSNLQYWHAAVHTFRKGAEFVCVCMCVT
jgi:hypothetical protein